MQWIKFNKNQPKKGEEFLAICEHFEHNSRIMLGLKTIKECEYEIVNSSFNILV